MGAGAGAFSGISTDTRKVGRGELFVALSGPRFDGHDFVRAALAAGAAGVLVKAGRLKAAPEPGCAIEVPDTLRALQDIASYVRTRNHATPVVGVTGTNGKTTTKEMLHAILSVRGPVLKNEGNLNNEIGLPLTLVKLGPEHWAAVLEMGMSAPGEIARLAEIAKPGVGIITNIGPGHLESLGDVHAVARAKGELIDSLPEDGRAVLNMDDPRLSGLIEKEKARAVTFGLGSGAMFRADSITEAAAGIGFRLMTPSGNADVLLPAIGLHNVMNALAASSAAWCLGVNVDEMVAGLQKFSPAAMRMELVEVGGVRVINDAYNANPASMAAALNTLANCRGCRRVAVLGDMLELGASSADSHYTAGRLAGAAGISLLVLVGAEAGHTARGAEDSGMDADGIIVAPSSEDAAELVAKKVTAGDCVLVKGSRGMRMELVVQRLKAGRVAA
jgi:UDP-N-acetylmuramoyl-tripeptide--D-alanyl-D-alanine ligase